MKEQLQPLPPSWTYMHIEEADQASASSSSRGLGPVRVLVLAIRDVVAIWWSRYFGGSIRQEVRR